MPGDQVRYLCNGPVVGADAQVTEARAVQRSGFGSGIRSGPPQVNLRLADQRVAWPRTGPGAVNHRPFGKMIFSNNQNGPWFTLRARATATASRQPG